MDKVETIKYKGYDINIYAEDCPKNPRKMWDNLGTMICFHRNYDLGDKTDLTSDDFEGWEELRQYLIKEKNAHIILPLYLYDHSGLRIKVGSFQGLLSQGHAEFDSGQIGYIYISKEKIQKEFEAKKIGKRLEKKVIKLLQAEVETFDDYVSGSVYGYQSIKDGENIDSYWGFYGYDFEENGLLDRAREEIDYIVEKKRKHKIRKLKALIKNKVNLEEREKALSK